MRIGNVMDERGRDISVNVEGEQIYVFDNNEGGGAEFTLTGTTARELADILKQAITECKPTKGDVR